MFLFGSGDEEKKIPKKEKKEKIKKEKKKPEIKELPVKKEKKESEKSGGDSDYNSKTIEQLKALLETRKLKKTGNKSDLIERLQLSFQCSTCSGWKEFKDKNKCQKCKNVQCGFCLHRCNKCSKKICSSCSTTCKCDTRLAECKSCHPLDKKCFWCNIEICSKLAKKCKDCNNTFCPNDAKSNGACHHVKCLNCKTKEEKCPKCGKGLCCSPSIKCNICLKEACSHCILACVKCKKPFCPKHLDVDTCKDCNKSKHQFKNDLNELTDAMKKGFELRSFFTCDKITDLPIIKIENDYLSLPFTEYVFEKFLKKFQKSPFGRGSDTIIDENFRKSYELSSDKVHLSQEFLDVIDANILPQIQSNLCPENSFITYDFYKLVVYEKGGFFKPHKDTQRTNNHFGTLIVFLPSVYEGGDFILSHDGVTKIFNHSINDESLLDIQWVSFFTDCVHEIKPIVSGHRIALTFNLFFDGEQDLKIPPLSLSNLLQEKLDNLYLNPEVSHSTFICYLLSHDYTKSTLGPRYLKGKDLVLYNQLSQLKYFKIEMKLIDTKIETDYEDENIKWEYMERRRLPNKSENSQIIYLNEEEFMKKDIQGMKPIHKNIWETGNIGTKISLQYKLTGLFISKKKREGSIDFAGDTDPSPLKKKKKESDEEEEIEEFEEEFEDQENTQDQSQENSQTLSKDSSSFENTGDSDFEFEEDIFECVYCRKILEKSKMILHIKEIHSKDEQGFLEILLTLPNH